MTYQPSPAVFADALTYAPKPRADADANQERSDRAFASQMAERPPRPRNVLMAEFPGLDKEDASQALRDSAGGAM